MDSNSRPSSSPSGKFVEGSFERPPMPPMPAGYPSSPYSPAARSEEDFGWRRDPFATPMASKRASTVGLSCSSSSDVASRPSRRYFHSRRIVKGEAARPWLEKKDPKEKWVTIIPIVGIVLGIAVVALLMYQGYSSVKNYTYCPVLDETWSNGIDPKIWTREAEVGGFGNGQFEQTTDSDENSFIKDGALHIKPTLQDAKLIDQNSVIDLRQGGLCSSDKWFNCIASTNSSNGSIVNPVKSARLSTRIGAKIKYGRVEVTAQLPAGDWLWPAIWMLPVDQTYGQWPLSGEIDIVESRGNDYHYAQGGNNIVSSTLHWGPDSVNDGWYQNNVKRKALRTTYSNKFNTFGLEWSEKYIFTYVNSRLMQVMYVNFDKPFWQKGNFAPSSSNGTRLVDPWSQTGRAATPFDQDFYLILNVAVGGTNGWFQDGYAGKPWVDASPYAKKDFWSARDTWFPTWQNNGDMIVKSVRMWQQQGHNGC